MRVIAIVWKKAKARDTDERKKGAARGGVQTSWMDRSKYQTGDPQIPDTHHAYELFVSREKYDSDVKHGRGLLTRIYGQ
jgi:hypothetical protein